MLPLALTIGEPAGIGPDIALNAWQNCVMARRISTWIGQRLAAAVVAAAAIAAVPAPLAAQQVVALVNGDPITAIDIAQRIKLIQISTQRLPGRQEVLDELIDEKLKLQIAKRYKLEITDSEVNSAFNTIASRAGSTPDKFRQSLAREGVSVEAVKTRIKADLCWSQIRSKFPPMPETEIRKKLRMEIPKKLRIAR